MATKRTPAAVALATKRVESNVRRLVVATRKTLESKVTENGRQRVSPSILGPVIRDMLAAGHLVEDNSFRLGPLLSLPDTPPEDLKRRQEEIRHAVTVFHKYASGSRNGAGVIGKAGEDMIERAFQASKTMIPFNWGEAASRQFRGVSLDQPSDGLVAIRIAFPGREMTDHIALAEVKNQRGWTTPYDHMPWKLIRNAYQYNVVGIYFSRRIMRSVFWLAFKRVGAIGIETFNQFAPPDIEADIAAARHKYGLGYHDLYFKTDVPSHLQKQVNALPERLMKARDRMNSVRTIVEPYLDALAVPSKDDATRKLLLAALTADLNAHDSEDDTEGEANGDVRHEHQDVIDDLAAEHAAEFADVMREAMDDIGP
jgi:hypothetical protein